MRRKGKQKFEKKGATRRKQESCMKRTRKKRERE